VRRVPPIMGKNGKKFIWTSGHRTSCVHIRGAALAQAIASAVHNETIRPVQEILSCAPVCALPFPIQHPLNGFPLPVALIDPPTRA